MIIDAATADLLWRTGQVLKDLRHPPLESLVHATIDAVAKEQGSYLESDERLAHLAVESMGLARAVELAVAEFPRDVARDLFDDWQARLMRKESPDLDPYMKQAKAVSDLELARFSAMMDIYATHGTWPELTDEEYERGKDVVGQAFDRLQREEAERKALGLGDEDVAV